MSADEDDTPTHQSEIDDEARLNRGFITVYEQTEDRGEREAGDRLLQHGYGDKRFRIDEETEGFVVTAVPLAHIELPEPITEEEFSNLVTSDLGALALQAFFPEMEPEGVTTEHWQDRRDTEAEA